MSKVLTKKPATDLKFYSGKWIALVEGRVIASAKSLQALMDSLKKIRLAKKHSVMLVPRKNEGPYILVLF